jgi:phosphoglucosamine mutase
VRTGRRLSELAAEVPLFPQQQRAIPARHRDGWAADGPFLAALEQAERELPGGRVIVRPSGTEPVLRIMVEGPDGGAVAHIADTLSRLAGERLD